MKKIKYAIITLFLLLISVQVNAEGIKIESITLEDKSAATEELSEPTYEGFNMNFDVRFYDVSDYAKYKIVIDNDTESDYTISNEVNDDSEFIGYKYEIEDSVKSKEKTTVYLTITYQNKVTSFVNDQYIEKASTKIQLATEEGVPAEDEVVENPETGVESYALLIGLVLISIYIINKKVATKNKFKYLSIIAVASILGIPMIVKATNELQFVINARIEIDKYGKFCVKHDFNAEIIRATYEIDQTFDEYVKSSLYIDENSWLKHPFTTFYTYYFSNTLIEKYEGGNSWEIANPAEKEVAAEISKTDYEYDTKEYNELYEKICQKIGIHKYNDYEEIKNQKIRPCSEGMYYIAALPS